MGRPLAVSSSTFARNNSKDVLETGILFEGQAFGKGTDGENKLLLQYVSPNKHCLISATAFDSSSYDALHLTYRRRYLRRHGSLSVERGW